MSDIEDYKERLAPFAGRRVLSAWVGGSHAHGLSDAGSDMDLRVILMPESREIMLGEASWNRSLHEPDVAVLTPLAYMHALLKGAPNMLESLTLPVGCLLLDSGLLRSLSPYAKKLVTCNTLKAATGNAKANIHALERRTDLSERKRNKMMAETERLLLSAQRVQAGGAAWPCRLDDDDIQTLRRIRETGVSVEHLNDSLRLTVDAVTPPLPPLDVVPRRQVEESIIDLHHRTLSSDMESFSMDDLFDTLSRFEASNE